MAAKVAAVQLFEGELDLLGYNVVSDVTLLEGSDVVRRITLETTPESDSRFPSSASQVYSTRNLYTLALANKTPARFQADSPVIV